jgi:ribosome recycling factor
MPDTDEPIDMADLRRRMQGAVAALRGELAGLRTGRASASILDPIMVEAYDTQMPLNQLATVSVPEPRMISVQVWDKATVGAVERAIRASSLGLNPVVEGTLMRLPIPELNEERRRELVKVAHQYAEQARVAIRHVRRDGMEELKALEKESLISEDESRGMHDEVQKATDEFVGEVDKALATKEQEILQV